MALFVMASAIVFSGCSKPAAERPFHDASHGFVISFPSSWTVDSKHIASPPSGEEITLTGGGLSITIDIGSPPDETSLPKMLRDMGWTESATQIDGVPALSFIPPAADRARGRLRRIEFAYNGAWYDLTLEVSPRVNVTKALRAFDLIVSSWRWDEGGSNQSDSSSGNSIEPTPEPVETASIVLDNDVLGQVVLNDQDILSRFERAWAQAKLVDWVQVSRGDRGFNLVQRLKSGDSRDFWLQYGTVWFQGKPYTGDLLKEVWVDLAMGLCKAQNISGLADKSSSVTLATKEETDSTRQVVLSKEQVTKLKSILGQLQVLGNADDEFPSGYQRPPSGYELRYTIGERVFTIWVLDSRDRALAVDLWGHLNNPVPFLLAPGIYEWAASILPLR
ncbi:MAG: hypothetical protein ACYC41_12785 [Bacillota bacterium]